MKIQKGDFIELEYTGATQEGSVFDTTDEKLAKEKNIHMKQTKYGPVVVCVGEKHLLAGLDEQIIGKEQGSYTIKLAPEQAFGKRNAKLIQLIATSKFTKQGVKPEAGMQIIVDNHIGTVKSVTGGRTVVDFNHPMAGKEITYDIRIKGRVENNLEKAKALLAIEFNIGKEDIQPEGGKLKIMKEVQEELREHVKERIRQMTQTEVEF